MKKISYALSTCLVILFTACNSKDSSEKQSQNNDKNVKTEDKGTYELNDEGLAIVDKVDSTKIAEINTALFVDSEEKYHYIYNLEKGKSYSFSTKNVEKYTATNSKESISTSQENTDKMLFTVKNDKGSYYEMEAKFISSKMSGSGQGTTVVIDTDKPEPKEEVLKRDWKLKKTLMGSTFQFHLSKTGTVSNVTGIDAIITKVQNGIKSQLTPEQLSDVTKMLKEQFLNPTVLKEQFESTMVKFPKDGVKLGGTWTQKDVKGTTTFKLTKIDGNVFVITLQSSLPTDKKTKTKNGVTASFTVSGNTNGTLNVDKNTGWISNGQYTKTLQANTTMSMGTQSETRKEKRVMTSYINP